MSSTTMRRAFAAAWLAGDESARQLLGGGFDDAAKRAESVQRASARRPHPDVVEELADQHRGLPPSPSRQRQLDRLAAGPAAAVVSGQQVGLFTGPAFSLYKAAGVVAAARTLEAQTGIACVPVFWLQTEDHDWPEIDHCFVRGPAGRPQRIAVGGDGTPDRASVSARRYGAEIDVALAQLESAVSSRPFATETTALFRRHYRRGSSPAESFRGVLAEIFADDGLLFFDPRRPRVARLAAPVFGRCLAEATPLAAALQRRSRAIEERGFDVQVHVRPESPLFFLHPDGPGGPRCRLERGEEGWRLPDRAVALGDEDVRRHLVSDPLAASSSALLRPLLQDLLFPTAMYLAGPGEIAYFAQLAPLYDAFGVEMPLVAPRPSFCVTEAADRRRLEALGLGPADLLQERESLLERLACEDEPDLEKLLTVPFFERLDGLAKRAVEVDPSLAAVFEKTRSTVAGSVKRLADRYRRGVADRDSVAARRLDALRDALAPDGVPQERRYGLACLAARHGVGAIGEALRREIVPFDGEMKEIAL